MEEFTTRKWGAVFPNIPDVYSHATQETIRQQKQPASPETVHGVAWIFESSSFFHLIEMLCFPRLRTSCSRNYSAFSENPHISPVSAAFCFCFSFLEWLKKNEEFRIYLSFGELSSYACKVFRELNSFACKVSNRLAPRASFVSAAGFLDGCWADLPQKLRA